MREIGLIHRFHVEAMDQFGIADGAEMQAGGAQILQPLLRPVTQPLVRQFARCQQVVVQIRLQIPISSSSRADGRAAACLIGQQADLLAARLQMPKGIQRTRIRRRSVMQYACGVEDETVIVIRDCGDAVHYRGSRRQAVGHGWCSRLGTDRRSFPRSRPVSGWLRCRTREGR